MLGDFLAVAIWLTPGAEPDEERIVSVLRERSPSGTVIGESLVGATGLVAKARARRQPRGHADAGYDRERQII
jgi:hypothetical protein